MENIFIDALCKMASEDSNKGAKRTAAVSGAVGAAGALTYAKATKAIDAARDRYIRSSIKGDRYNRAFLSIGGEKKGVKNPFSAAKRLMSHKAKVEALKTTYGAGGVARKVAKGGRIAASLGAAGVLAAGAKSLMSKKKED